MASTQQRLFLSADEFLSHPAAQTASELVRGEVRFLTPASGAHGLVAGQVFAAINAFVKANDLGMAFPDNTGFHLPGLRDTVRSPDAAFIRRDRLPPNGISTGWITVAPDLIVEVRSPDESQRTLDEKLADYKAAGTRYRWIVDPEMRTVLLTSDEIADRLLTVGETIDDVDVLPGFTLEVASLFVGLAI